MKKLFWLAFSILTVLNVHHALTSPQSVGRLPETEVNPPDLRVIRPIRHTTPDPRPTGNNFALNVSDIYND